MNIKRLIEVERDGRGRQEGVVVSGRAAYPV
jgi:hypothetical protein